MNISESHSINSVSIDSWGKSHLKNFGEVDMVYWGLGEDGKNKTKPREVEHSIRELKIPKEKLSSLINTSIDKIGS